MEEPAVIKKTTYTPSQKLCIYKWRLENPELHKRINRKGNATFYAKNREKVIQAVLERRKRKLTAIESLGSTEASNSVK